MSKYLVAFVFLFLVSARAEESERGGVSQTENHFRLVTFKCAPEKHDGPESTPQSPPLDVDDPGTPGCNQWEINLVADGDLARGQKNWELPLLDINYGIGDNLQLKYEVPYVNQETGSDRQSALGEAKLGIKFAFFQSEESDEQIAIYPQMSIVSPDRDAVSKGVASSGKVITLPVLYTRKIGQTRMGDVTFTANLGVNLSSKADTTHYLSFSAGVGVPVHSRIALMGELSTDQGIGSLDAEPRQQLTKVNLGLIGTVSKNVLFFASAGHSISSSDESPHAYVLSGVRLLTSNF